MIDVEMLYETSKVWCPSYPRQATFSDDARQRRVETRGELISNLSAAANSGGPAYSSVYSFPRGHSRDNKIPRINTLFLDFDIPQSEGSYDTRNGGSLDDWRDDMQKLLARANLVADGLLNAGLEDHVRVSLSGHKGIHLYIDFDDIPSDLGSIDRYKRGLEDYANLLIDSISDYAGIELEKWIDVTSDDLGRLARHPNTPHHGAKHVNWTPYCVPSSVKELSNLDENMYLTMTREPRSLSDIHTTKTERINSERATEKVTEMIKSADTNSYSSRNRTGSYRDTERLENYQEQSNDDITIDTVTEILTKDKPCLNAFRERDDAFSHGQESRTMQINIIKDLASKDVPIDVIVDFFRPIDGFNEEYCQSLVKDIIARYHPSSFVCQNIVDSGGEFCLGEKCQIYNFSEDLDLSQ